jgi:hypothetical protein
MCHFNIPYFETSSLNAQATRPDAGAMAGAMLIPIVTNAQNTAAKTEAIWLREESCMVHSFAFAGVFQL